MQANPFADDEAAEDDDEAENDDNGDISDDDDEMNLKLDVSDEDSGNTLNVNSLCIQDM